MSAKDDRIKQQVTHTISIIKYLDRLPRTKLIRKSKIRHIRSARRSIDRKETQPRRRNILQLRIRMRHQLITLLRSRIKQNRIVHLVISRIRHLLIRPVKQTNSKHKQDAQRPSPRHHKNACTPQVYCRTQAD